MNNQIEFKLSTGSWIGLASIAIASVLMFTASLIGSMVAFHPPVKNYGPLLQSRQPCDCPNDSLVGRLTTNSELRMPVRETIPPVNQTARDEVKQAGGAEDTKEQCPPGVTCRRPAINWTQYSQTTYQPVQYSQPMVIPTQVSQSNSWPGRSQASAMASQLGARLVESVHPGSNSISVHAVLQNGLIWNASGSANTKTYEGVNCYLAVLDDMQRGASSPTSVTPPGSHSPSLIPESPTPSPTPTPNSNAPSTNQGRHQLVLFLNPNDSTSKVVSNWFETNPNLRQLKANCATEIMTESSPMYLARFAKLVQPKDFPAVLFMQPDGGHIYAVGRPMLPRNAEMLLSDMRAGLKLAQSVQQSTLVMQSNTSGAIKSQGYNWDHMINDNIQLVKSQEFPNQDSCVDRDGDGECDTEQREPWYPGKKVHDLLGGERQPGIEAVLWANGSELVQIFLGLVVVVLVAAIAFKLIKKQG